MTGQRFDLSVNSRLVLVLGTLSLNGASLPEAPWPHPSQAGYFLPNLGYARPLPAPCVSPPLEMLR